MLSNYRDKKKAMLVLTLLLIVLNEELYYINSYYFQHLLAFNKKIRYNTNRIEDNKFIGLYKIFYEKNRIL